MISGSVCTVPFVDASRALPSPSRQQGAEGVQRAPSSFVRIGGAAGSGRSILQSSLLVAAFLLLAACASVGPDYVRPDISTPAQYKAVSGTWKSAQPGDTLPRGKWWELFGDPQLNALAERVDGGNQSIRQAEAQYAQARAALRQAQAGRYPFVAGSASARRSRVFSGSAGAASDFELGADVSWEADVWGRVRRTIESGEAQAQAAAADVESVRLAVTAALAQSYLLLRITDQQVRLFEDSVAAFNRSLTLTRNRYNAGVVSKADVVQAEAQVKSTQAQLVDLGVQRAQLEHAIAALIGETPATLAVAPGVFVAKLPAIPAGLPTELLERRPDIANAERRVAAANARIGVAQAALFPSLSLSAAGGITSTTLPELLRAPTLFWALGASAIQVLFDGGARRAATDQARAALDAEAAFYRQSVLTSIQEVEDSLVTLRILEEEAKLQDAAVAAARESLKLTENRYKAGTIDFLAVVVAQNIALSNERASVGILGRRFAASVQLVKALGGGWDARALEQVSVRQGGAAVR
jgi:NodT family efflux transporter outer membrane factor (OMF) lipoprotein